MKLKTFLSSALLGSALLFGATAQAASIPLGNLDAPDFAFDYQVEAGGLFSDTFTFNLTETVDIVATLNEHTHSIAGFWNIDNLKMSLYDAFDNELAVSGIANDGAHSSISTNLDAGSYYFKVGGTAVGSQGGSYTLTVSTTDDSTSTTPVPEAETYAMLLGGLGLIGFVAARRRKQA